MKVKNIQQLQALAKSGAMKVDGMKPEEPKPEQPTISLEPLVAAIRESMEKQTKLSEANTKALYTLILSFAKRNAEGLSRPRRWKFTVNRDEDGFMEKIIAEASE